MIVNSEMCTYTNNLTKHKIVVTIEPMKHSDIIDRLGGIRPLATALGIEHHSKVQGWKQRNSIPAKWFGPILTAAKTLKVKLRAEDFISTDK